MNTIMSVVKWNEMKIVALTRKKNSCQVENRSQLFYFSVSFENISTLVITNKYN